MSFLRCNFIAPMHSTPIKLHPILINIPSAFYAQTFYVCIRQFFHVLTYSRERIITQIYFYIFVSHLSSLCFFVCGVRQSVLDKIVFSLGHCIISPAPFSHHCAILLKDQIEKRLPSTLFVSIARHDMGENVHDSFGESFG